MRVTGLIIALIWVTRLWGQCTYEQLVAPNLGGWPSGINMSQLVGLVNQTSLCGLTGDLGPAPAGASTLIATVEVRNDRNRDRVGEIAWSGIPVPQATNLLNTDNLTLIRNGRRYASQFRVLARWDANVDDVSAPIRWLEVSIADGPAANETLQYQLRRYDNLPPAIDPFAVSLTPDNGNYVVDTGLADFVLDPTQPGLIQTINVAPEDDGRDRRLVYSHVPGAGPFLSFEGSAGAIDLSTAVPGQVVVDPGSFEVVEAGPVKVVVHYRGHFVAPAGESLCTINAGPYERFGFSAAFTFNRASRDVLLRFHVRNECSTGFSSPWDDQTSTVHEASWRLPLPAGSMPQIHYGGTGALQSTAANFAGNVVVAQEKGSGVPWQRSARATVNGLEAEAAQAFDSPFVAAVSPTWIYAVQMPWMAYREPQALAYDQGALQARAISETLVVGEGKGIWNEIKWTFRLRPDVLRKQKRGALLDNALAELRSSGRDQLERGLLVRATLADVNAAQVFPSLGTDTATVVRDAYLVVMEAFHRDTVSPGDQWDRAKTYGSQLWPDVQFDLYSVDWDDPYENSGAMNYWNPSGAEMFEFLRGGDPKWAWDFALPQSWLQMYAAYLNLGDRNHGNRNGFAVNSGGVGEGNWHRWDNGSDDYSYNMGMQLAYLLRPDPILRHRFGQAGRTIVDRYNIPKANEGTRQPFVNQIVLSRQVVQHLEMLANCAEFTPGTQGNDCRNRLQEILLEIAQDNLRSGLLCWSDVPDPGLCGQPQQFMQNALVYPFLVRMFLHYGDVGGNLRNALIEAPRNYYEYGINKMPNGVDIDWQGEWAAAMECALSNGGTQVDACARVDIGGGLNLLWPNKPHSIAALLFAHELDPNVNLCNVAKTVLDDAAFYGTWLDYVANNSGWWKGAGQMMQNMVFAVGLYESCP